MFLRMYNLYITRILKCKSKGEQIKNYANTNSFGRHFIDCLKPNTTSKKNMVPSCFVTKYSFKKIANIRT